MSTVTPSAKDRRTSPRAARRTADAAAPASTPVGNVAWIPPALTLALFLISLTPRVQAHAIVLRSFWSVIGALIVWQATLYLLRGARGLSIVLAPPRPQHYIQAMCHISVYAYWGWYWRPVYDYAWLLVAQIVFAYAFDMLLSWSRRGSYVLGFGPFPIIFSTNLFLWFRDDWFYLQFILVAVGFLGKEFVRWHRDGRLVHIFNPSGFSLSLFSVALIATNTTHLTWGPEIASTLSLAPHIYVFLFGIGLVVMYFFSVTLVAASAAATLFSLSALYQSMTGVPYFLDSEIPSAVFLGLHLLVTDPSTSPRTPLGRLFFGILYGLGVFGLYSLLGAMGAPTFYDKLMCVPLLNLSVPLDRSRGGRDREAADPGKPPARRSARQRQSGAHGCLDGLLRDHDGDWPHRRPPHRRQPSVLAAGLRSEPAERVPAFAAGRTQLLRRQLGVGLQRARRPLCRGQARVGRRRRSRSDFSRARASCGSRRRASTCSTPARSATRRRASSI